MCVFLKIFFLDHLEHGKSCSGAHRIPTKGVEVTSSSQDFGNMRSCHDCPYRYSISYALHHIYSNKWCTKVSRNDEWAKSGSLGQKPIIMRWNKHLGHGNDVRDYPVGFESPEMGAGASKPSLNFVSYTEPSCFLYAAIDCGQVTRGQFYDSSHTLPRDSPSEFSIQSDAFNSKTDATERKEYVITCIASETNAATWPEVA